MSANSPNPLLPQGSLEKQTSKAKSNVKVAVFSIVAVHAVLIVGVLMQGGCKKDEPKPTTQTEPGQPAAPTGTDAFYSPTNDLTSTSAAPATAVGGTPAPMTDTFAPTTPAAPASTSSVPTTVGSHPAPAPAVVDTHVGAPTGIAPMGEQAGPVQQYKVVKGDMFYSIAKKNKTTVAKLTAANPGVDPAKLKIGQTLNIPAPATPAAAPAAPATTTASADVSAPAASGNTTTYEVKSGDTLFGISKKTGASVKAIRAANNLKVDQIKVGQKLKIPAKATATATATAAPEPVTTTPVPVTPPSAPLTATSSIPITPRAR